MPDLPAASARSDGGPRAPRIVVGLGNPGAEYDGTRHNVGFEALDLLATRLGASPSTLKVGGQRLARWFRTPEGSSVLLWPLTYMNRSGGAVVAALRRVAAPPASLFVLCDDFHLPLGALRARPEGSPGGHKGLLSIERSLGLRSFARLRIGVGQPGPDTVDFVLSRFRASERKVIEETLETASWAAEDWLQGLPIAEIQSRYNRRTP